MSLDEYRKKRDFKKTTEPEPKIQPGSNQIYVIQRHEAQNLHWDFRLERDGVLISWAVPKEPPTKKGVRRLAIQTEDHPMEYASFSGVIPEGEYGAGTVELWDQGTYDTVKWEEKEIIVVLNGKRLKGQYCLIRFQKVKDGWLFFRCGE
ncbi:MAG: DNA polymerase ligase N-terminal domain-containing protein [Candidatus Hermodarchaeota archaeon]|nr:DNA polymerase ligase N-terminal domain-containing protein [Candidatus Hermodarchaeota archaeon]